MSLPPYEIRASARRRKTMAAFREDGRLVVAVPARMTARQRADLIPALVERFLADERKRGAPRGDAELTGRVLELWRRYFPDAPPPALGARWVTNQDARWGSASPATGELRISDRLRAMPGWVVDYVLVHEAAHLLESGHTARFRALEGRYPHAERAKAFLDGVAFARRQWGGRDA